MEKKLMELKEEFCKFYCKYKNEEVTCESECSNPVSTGYCGECDREIKCDCESDSVGIFEPCSYCQLENYIKFTRDDL